MNRLGPYEMDTVVVGDCLDVLRQMPDGCVDLVFADPPYNSGKDFGDNCDDRRPDYWEWTKVWLGEIWRVLRSDGSCYLKQYWRNVGRFDMLVRALDGIDVRNLIVWQKSGGLAGKARYSLRWEAIWSATKGGGYTFNLDDVRVPSKTRDPRNHPLGKNPTDCWRIPRVAFGSRERVGHPTQSPLILLRRIITASSRKGDLVFDPFAGSGTTAVAAKALGRSYFGCDTNPEYVQTARGRLANVTGVQLSLLDWGANR